MKLACLPLILLVSMWSPNGHADNVLHTEKSLYSSIIVKKIGNTICLQFTIRQDQRNQSCINPDKPREMVFTYTRMSMAALLFAESLDNILIVGLGGGTLPTALHDLYPDAIIDSVEIDPAVVKVARRFFGFNETSHMRVITQDARVFTKRAARKPTRYDLIVLDAFNGDYIPEHLMTREFLEEAKAILAPGGTLMANTFAISDLYDHESNTYQAVFDSVISFSTMQTGNRVIIAPTVHVSDEEILRRARELRGRLAPYSVPIGQYARKVIEIRRKGPDWNTSARVLTDQYSPANLLDNE